MRHIASVTCRNRVDTKRGKTLYNPASELSHACGSGADESHRPLGSDYLRLNTGALIDALPDPVLLMDGAADILLFNKPAATLLCLASGSPRTSIPDVFPWPDLRALLNTAQRGLRHVEEIIHDPARDQCWLVTIRRLLPTLPGSSHFVVHLKDQTQTVKLRRSLHANDALARTGSVLAASAHQAKNTLFGICATVEALRLRHRDELVEDALLKSLSDAVAHMKVTFRDLLDLCAGACHERDLLAVDELLKDTANACRPLARQGSVLIKTRLSPGMSTYGTANLLQRAFENVIDNAVRHSPEQSTVCVELQPSVDRQGWIQITVTDSGRGFPLSKMDRLFKPFFTTRPGGTGLGLVIARRIVEDHGGGIRLSNANSGGARVTILLPMDRRGSHGIGSAKSAELN